MCVCVCDVAGLTYTKQFKSRLTLRADFYKTIELKVDFYRLSKSYELC